MKTQIFTAISIFMILALLLPAGEIPAIAQGHSAEWEVPASDHIRESVELQDAPLMFIENVGQFDPGARFQVHGDNSTIYLTGDVIWSTVLEDPPASHPVSPQEGQVPTPTPEPGQVISGDDQPHLGVNIKYYFIGANSNPQLEPFNRLDTLVSYFIGDDPARWQPSVPAWGGVRYRDLYPGVDLEMTGESGQWIWRLVTQEAASLGAVQLRVEGMDNLAVDGSGRLHIETAVGNIIGPVVIASLNGPMTAAIPNNVLMQAVIEGEMVSFLPSDESYTSPIQPADINPGELAYSTFLGGSNFDAGNAIAAGSGGTAYITGETFSTNFPTTPGAFDVTANGNSDIFVTKLQSAGNTPAFSTFLGGFGQDQGYAIAADAAGSVYVVGSTYSSNFPVTAGAFDATYNGSGDVVAVKLSAAGNALLYSTYLGGNSIDLGLGLGIDGAGGAYLTGETWSSNFPVTPGAFDTTWNGLDDTFVTKLNTVGSALEYSTYLGGPSYERGNGVAVDSGGNAYVVGLTGSTNFPTTSGAFDTTLAGHNDVFITKLNGSGTALLYSGLLGGNGDDQGQGIAVDAFGAAYVTGQTASSNFTVTPGAYDTRLGGSWDGFVAKISPGGDQLIYSTYLGGSANDCETTNVVRECVIAVDGFRVAYVAGRTLSPDFPTTPNGFDTGYKGSEDGFMARLNPDGSSLVYGSFFGGTQSDQTLTVAVDTAGSAYVSGRTYSPNFPISPGAFDPGYNGGGDVFAIKLLVGGMTLSVQPPSVPADGATAATITLSGAPVGHQVHLISSRGSVDIFASATGIVNSLGQFATTIRSSTSGVSTLTVQDLTTGQTFALSAQVTFTGGDETLPPIIGTVDSTGVHSQYPLDARYLEGVPLSNRIDVTVDWKGAAPGRVDFILNGQTYSEPTSGTGASHTFDMGQDLQGGRNHLSIVAYNAAGQVSLPRDFSLYLLERPAWMAALQTTGALADFIFNGPVGLGREYKSTFQFPEQPISLGAPGFGPPGSNAELRLFVGGSARLGLQCEQPLIFTGEAGAKPRVDLMGIEFGGEFKGRGELIVGAVECTLPTGQGTLGVDITVYGQKNSPVLTFVIDFIAPGAGTSLEQTLRAAGLYKLTTIMGEIYLQGKLEPFFESNARLQEMPPHLLWEGVRVGGGGGFEAGYRLQQLGAEFRVFFGASPKLAYWNPNSLTDLTDLRFDQLTVTGEGGWELKPPLMPCKYGETYRVEWTYPPSHFEATKVSEETCSFFRSSYQGTYAAFQATPGAFHAFKPAGAEMDMMNISAQTTVTSVLVSNVYTYPELSLAVNPIAGDALITWVHDDISKPVGQSHEIYFSHWDGSSWSAPAGVTDDDRLDGAPWVAWTADSNAVAVWERLNEILPITATWDVTHAKKIEIATSVYSSTTGVWSPMTLLTTNTTMDMTPQLARNGDGQLLAVWRQNEAGLLGGDADNPDRIIAAFYDEEWGPPAVAVEDIPGLMDLAAGYGNGAAMIAYTSYLTPTGYPTPTLQLFTSTWDGLTWSTPTQHTDDALGHRNPQLLYNTANQPLLVWLAGDTLRLRNLITGDTASLSLPAEIGDVDEFRVVQDTAGNLAAVFAAQAAQRDLYLALYDRVHNLWGGATGLTRDRAAEAYPAPAYGPTDRLLLGYAATVITDATRTTIMPGTGEVITYTVPVEGRTDLLTLSHDAVRNLTLTAEDLAVSADHPAPGSNVVISATVLNSGDLAMDGVAVSFFDGDPGSGGSLIGTDSLPVPLAAGFTATLTTTYNVPTTGGARVLYAVADPADTIPEGNETDNIASLTAFGPDLEIVAAAVDYWGGSEVGLRTLIRNTGTSPAPATTLAFYHEALTGTLAVADSVPTLSAGEEMMMTTSWNFGGLAAGSYPMVVVVNQADFTETFTANNSYTFPLEVRPDLMVSPYYLWAMPLGTSTAAITATVFNIGPVEAANVTVGFYRSATLDAAALAFTRTISRLGPGQTVQLSGQVDIPPGSTIYVLVDPDWELVETTRENNLASATVHRPVQVGFSAAPLSGVAPLLVAFTDQSSGDITSWLWAFGDGSGSTLANPVHIYLAPGIYNVSLTVSGPGSSDVETKVGYITVQEGYDLYLPLIVK
jgi:PKD repeat protein